MNILFLMKVFEVGGQEVVTATLAKNFVDHGCNVCIASFKKPSFLMIERVDKRVSFYTIGSFQFSNENVKNLRNVLIRNKIDIVINQWGLPYIPAKVLVYAKRGLSVKTIAVYHNSPDTNARIKDVEIAIDKTTNLIKKKILFVKKVFFTAITCISMRYVYKNSDLYMVLSPSFVEKFKKFTYIRNLSKLVVQTNPVTVDYTDYNYVTEKKRKEIIYVGRIDYNQKRVYRVIDTWKLLEKSFPDWKLIIVGDGVERLNLEKQVQRLGLQNVFFMGFQEPKSYYERSSILMLTSEYEGFPLVLAECMSFGVVPVVYGSYSAVYDIIKHKENGIIVPPQLGRFDAKAMANALSILMRNELERKKMAEKAVYTGRNDYSLETIYDSWKKYLYD